MLLAATVAPAAVAQPPNPAPPIFRFEADEFWLNLHHFSYVLGPAEAKTADASREAVAGARLETTSRLPRVEYAPAHFENGSRISTDAARVTKRWPRSSRRRLPGGGHDGARRQQQCGWSEHDRQRDEDVTHPCRVRTARERCFRSLPRTP
jgi:hypothetical protein